MATMYQTPTGAPGAYFANSLDAIFPYAAVGWVVYKMANGQFGAYPAGVPAPPASIPVGVVNQQGQVDAQGLNRVAGPGRTYDPATGTFSGGTTGRPSVPFGAPINPRPEIPIGGAAPGGVGGVVGGPGGVAGGGVNGKGNIVPAGGPLTNLPVVGATGSPAPAGTVGDVETDPWGTYLNFLGMGNVDVPSQWQEYLMSLGKPLQSAWEARQQALSAPESGFRNYLDTVAGDPYGEARSILQGLGNRSGVFAEAYGKDESKLDDFKRLFQMANLPRGISTANWLTGQLGNWQNQWRANRAADQSGYQTTWLDYLLGKIPATYR